MGYFDALLPLRWEPSGVALQAYDLTLGLSQSPCYSFTRYDCDFSKALFDCPFFSLSMKLQHGLPLLEPSLISYLLLIAADPLLFRQHSGAQVAPHSDPMKVVSPFRHRVLSGFRFHPSIFPAFSLASLCM